ncbi:sensor histidine kinase [Conexibacter sp. JD483]|uniref:sensor histidine kinase n=1 Tax=unclassified Conexibacter TaxID=2627773 RepID=UPI002715D05E|nr:MULTISPECIES: sensor histidine kinase [unclassified Conexibacter]MDO8188973.1 sensor histidine kinase [Conexibacter sp. CPCC 205706]MDO8201781.1 sensor histidine kinase [Conexibacter sp. CPCC 205762]MDR9371446.1 sensor histidine kinase [Conexibacter sp. JD483]
MPLLWRVLAINAVVLVVAVAVLLLTPVTVSDPPTIAEIAALFAGVLAVLLVLWLLLHRAFVPLERLAAFARRVDPLRPGERAAVGSSDPQVAATTRAINEMIERLERERRESAREALSAQEAERIRIARELHDEVGQTLTAVVLQLERAARDAAARDVAAREAPHPRDAAAPSDAAPARDELLEHVEEARELARHAAEEVREIARRLRPEALDDLGIASALVSLATASGRHSGVRVSHRIDGALPPLGDDAELVVYRVAQEALTNVARHAGADAAELLLEAAPAGCVTLTVRDHGAGFDPSAVAGGERGIRGMRERAVLVDARLEIDSAPGAGTIVRLTIPCGASAANRSAADANTGAAAADRGAADANTGASAANRGAADADTGAADAKGGAR